MTPKPQKTGQMPSPGCNLAKKMGQKPVNLEMSPKCCKNIGKSSQPIGKQLRQSTHPNLLQGPSPRRSRDLSPKHPRNGPTALPGV